VEQNGRELCTQIDEQCLSKGQLQSDEELGGECRPQAFIEPATEGRAHAPMHVRDICSAKGFEQLATNARAELQKDPPAVSLTQCDKELCDEAHPQELEELDQVGCTEVCQEDACEWRAQYQEECGDIRRRTALR